MRFREMIGVLATDPHGVIGKKNQLPWHYPDELEHFRKITYGNVIVMGRKTAETLPDAILKERIPVVFTRQYAGSWINRAIGTAVSSIEAFLETLEQWKHQKIFMIGGAEIAHLFLEKELLTGFILTRIHRAYEGDVSFNLDLLKDWPGTILSQTETYTIYNLKNPKRRNHELS